jgi:N-methylhydantoinase A
MNYKLGIDIGGTFTDFSLLNVETNELISFKISSTPKSPAKAIRTGLQRLKNEKRIDLADIKDFVHGTTIPVNTLIQRNGANLCLFVTEGFADLLELQRLRLPNIFDLHGVRPNPLIPRQKCIQIRERIRFDGSIEMPLDEKSIFKANQEALSHKVQGIF